MSDEQAQQAQQAEPAPSELTSNPTVADLDLPQGAIASPKWQASQYIEPTRDGEPWCTREDAEAMLVLAAKSAMRGHAGIKATKYELTESGSVLALRLG